MYKYRDTFIHDGKRYDIKAKTARELVEKINKKKAQLDNALVDGNTTLENWIDKWLKTYKSGKVSVGWEKTIKSILSTSIPSEIKGLKIKDVRTIHAQQILNTASGKSESYIHKLTITLNELFEIARKNRMISDNPMELTEPPKGTRNKRRALTEKERAHILKLAETHRAGMFVKIMLYCGLRPQEVAVLQWKDISWTDSTLSVNKALKSNNSVGEPKSQSGIRIVPIPKDFMEELKAIKEQPFSYVCTQAGGDRHTKTSIRQMWKSFVYQLNKQMGCKTSQGGALIPPYPVADDLVMYCLRHTYGTDLIKYGVDIYDVKESMGHGSVTVTEGYTHKSDETLKRVADKINSYQKNSSVENGVETNAVSIGK